MQTNPVGTEFCDATFL